MLEFDRKFGYVPPSQVYSVDIESRLYLISLIDSMVVVTIRLSSPSLSHEYLDRLAALSDSVPPYSHGLIANIYSKLVTSTEWTRYDFCEFRYCESKLTSAGACENFQYALRQHSSSRVYISSDLYHYPSFCCIYSRFSLLNQLLTHPHHLLPPLESWVRLPETL